MIALTDTDAESLFQLYIFQLTTQRMLFSILSIEEFVHESNNPFLIILFVYLVYDTIIRFGVVLHVIFFTCKMPFSEGFQISL